MDDRHAQALAFLQVTDWAGAKMCVLAGDASARRYFRVVRNDGARAVLMDAPPPDQEVMPFLNVAAHLRKSGLSAPDIFASDVHAGFILMEDLGDDLFASVTAKDPQSEQQLYEVAVDVLITLDRLKPPEFVTDFDTTTMVDQTALVFDWYARDTVQEQSILAGLETELGKITQQSLLLRDYHAENLIWLPGRSGVARAGVLDFQDAMTGPAGYDLVSLLQDARRDVSRATCDAMIQRFVSETGKDAESFAASYAAIGLQRNLRILGIFARLCLRDGKPRYVDFIPRVWGYVQESLAHPSLCHLADLVDDALPAPTPALLQGLKDRCGTIPPQ